jgi:hypothetical protein
MPPAGSQATTTHDWTTAFSWQVRGGCVTPSRRIHALPNSRAYKTPTNRTLFSSVRPRVATNPDEAACRFRRPLPPFSMSCILSLLVVLSELDPFTHNLTRQKKLSKTVTNETLKDDHRTRSMLST